MRPLYVGVAAVAVVLAVMLVAAPVAAGPARGEPETLVQPTGESFQATLHGDEWFNWTATEGGDVVVKGGDGFWYYAAVVDGRLVPGPAKCAIDRPPLGALSASRIPALVREGLLAPDLDERRASALLPLPPAGLSGPEKALVLLVEFADTKLFYSTEGPWNDLIFGAAGSTVRTYYSEVSRQGFYFTPAAETWGKVNDGVVKVSLPYNHPNTGDNTGEANRTIVKDALTAANPYVNFAAFDTNGNGGLSTSELHIVTIIAGYEASYGGYSPSVWGHRWSLATALTLDGKRLCSSAYGGGYTQQGERHGDHRATIGILCHELGHDVGLPDLYDYDGSSLGVGIHSLMASGTWASIADEDDGSCPTHLDAWSKQALGFVVPVVAVGGDYTVNGTGPDTSYSVIKVPTANPKQYFLIENRQFSGFDASLDYWCWGGGLLILHVDEDVIAARGGYRINDNEYHKAVDVEEANEDDLGYSQLDVGDVYSWYLHHYRVGWVRTFGPSTIPSSDIYVGADDAFGYPGYAPSFITLTAVTGSGAVMTVNVSRPGVTLVESDGATAVTEGGATDTYTVALNRQPTGNVTVTAKAGPKVRVNGTTSVNLTFTTTNWNVPRTVTVSAVDDPAVEGSHADTITHVVTGGGFGTALPGPAVSVTITDNDEPSATLTQTGGATAVAEGGATDSYTIVLGRQPGGNVTMTATAADGKVTVNGAASANLTFTPTTWNRPQAVTVRAVDDAFIEAAHTATITHSIAGSGFDGLVLPDITVAITDNDPAAPRALTAATTPDGVLLTWQAAPGAAPAGYELYINTAATGTYTKIDDVTTWEGASPNYEVTALDFAGDPFTFTAGRTYYFQVRAYGDLKGVGRVRSLPSNTASAVAGPLPPQAPRTLVAATTANGVSLGWLAPLTGVTPNGYEVYVAAASAGPYTLAKDVTGWPGANPGCEVTALDLEGTGFSLDGGKRYYFRVQAYILPTLGGRARSGPSNTAYAVTGPQPPRPPTLPTARTTATGVALGWTPPATGLAPEGYPVYIGTSSRGPFTFVRDVTSWTGDLPNVELTATDFDGTGFAFNGGVRYYFAIYSYAEHPLTAGQLKSATALACSATAGPLPPLPPKYPKATPANNGFTLTWTTPTTGLAPVGYRVLLSRTSAGPYALCLDVTSWAGAAPNSAVTDADLAACGLTYAPGARFYARIYSYAVHPVTGGDLVSVSYASTTATAGPIPPRPPSRLTARTAPSGVTLRWLAPTGTPPAGYVVYISTSASGSFVAVKDVTSWTGTYPNCAVTIADCAAVGFTMTPGTRYYFRVYSFNPHPITGDKVLSPTWASAYAAAGATP